MRLREGFAERAKWAAAVTTAVAACAVSATLAAEGAQRYGGQIVEHYAEPLGLQPSENPVAEAQAQIIDAALAPYAQQAATVVTEFVLGPGRQG